MQSVDVVDELSPCPFCAPEDSDVALYNGGPGCFFVMCGTCNCQTTDGTKDRVVSAWNDRTVEDGGEMLISTWLRNQATFIRDLDSGSDDAKNLDAAANEIEHLRMRRDELKEALATAIAGWSDGANYKGEYLKAKHGDAEGIAAARAVLEK